MACEALSSEFRTGCSWELLYADDLVLIAESMEELVGKFTKWKDGIECKGLKVNMKKTKVLVSSPVGVPAISSGTWPCSVCRKGVGSNSILCNTCKHWVHERCSRVKGSLNSV